MISGPYNFAIQCQVMSSVMALLCVPVFITSFFMSPHLLPNSFMSRPIWPVSCVNDFFTTIISLTGFTKLGTKSRRRGKNPAINPNRLYSVFFNIAQLDFSPQAQLLNGRKHKKKRRSKQII